MVTYNGNHRVKGKGFQHVWLTHTVRGVEYQQVASAPASITDANIEGYILSQDRWKVALYNVLFPEAEGKTISEVEQWIADHPEVEPNPWESTHPKEATQEYQSDLDAYKNCLIVTKTMPQIKTWLNNNITDSKTRFFAEEVCKVLKIMVRNIEE